MHHFGPLSERFSFVWLVNVLFGGVRGWLEPIATVSILVYVALVLREVVRTKARDVDARLLWIGGAVFVFALLGPDKYMNTIEAQKS